jgi:hypothetical protein
MFSLLIKKEYRNKFKFTTFLYNELWVLCENYFEQLDEQNENSTKIVNAIVASYNIVLYCGRTAIDDNTKIHLEAFIKNQTKGFFNENKTLTEIKEIFYPSGDNAILLQLFKVCESQLQELQAEELYNNFSILKERCVKIFSDIEACQLS